MKLLYIVKYRNKKRDLHPKRTEDIPVRALFIPLLALAAQVWAANHAAADTAQILGQSGSWRYFLATDPMTDKQWYGAVVGTDDGQIQVDCVPSSPMTLNVLFSTKKYLGSGTRSVTYRIDSLPAHTDTGSYSAKGLSLLCDGVCRGDGVKSSSDERFIKQIMEGESLLMRMRTYDGETVEVRYSVSGATEAFQHITDGCKRLSETPKKKQPAK